MSKHEAKSLSDIQLAVDLGGLKMINPITVASGTFGSGQDFALLWEKNQPSTSGYPRLSDLGALTTKGVSLKPWAGNKGCRITETASGMMNSIGLQNSGVDAFCADDLFWLTGQQVPIIVNVSGHTLDEYPAVIGRLEEESTIAAYEINISCPNVDCGGMAFGTDHVRAEQITSACRTATKRPLIVKLSPNVTNITEIAKACEAGGADALSLINTVAGMAIDATTRTSVFDRKIAGLSGPAIKPIALWAVYQVHKAVDLPLLGMGGISTVSALVAVLLAGATAVAIGTANFTDPFSAPRLITELKDWCQTHGVADIHELIGRLG
jgi:dihydroorotate dehydrogenase (NAD+) catalytic subunit